MKEIKINSFVHYMTKSNCIARGKVVAKVNRFYKINNSNYLVSGDRIFSNEQQASKYFNQTKGWTKPEGKQC